MNIITLIIIVIALSTDVFSGIYLNGFIKEANWTERLKALLLVAGTGSLMAGLGFYTGDFVSGLLADFSKGLAIGILFIIGLKLFAKSFKPKFQEMVYELTQNKILLGFSMAMGMNAFLLGLAYPLFDVDVFSLMIVFAAVYSIAIILAMYFGKRSDKFIVAARLMLGGGLIIMGSAIYYILEQFKLI